MTNKPPTPSLVLRVCHRWTKRKEILRRVKITRQTLSVWLRVLVDTGLLEERIADLDGSTGRPPYEYRRL